VKTFSPKLHFGKEFSKKEVIWSLLAGRLTELYISQHQMRNEKPVSSSERDADSFQDLENISLTPKGSRLLKKWTNPILFYYFAALWRITSFVGRWNVSLNWSEFARLFGVVYKMFSGSSCCC
jgi:hypothetical protein